MLDSLHFWVTCVWTSDTLEQTRILEVVVMNYDTLEPCK